MGPGDHVIPESSAHAEKFHDLCPHPNMYTPASFRYEFPYCFPFGCFQKHRFSGSSKLFLFDLVCQKNSCVEAQEACVMGKNKPANTRYGTTLSPLLTSVKFSVMGTQ